MENYAGLERLAREELEQGYETGVAADPRVPSIRWEHEGGPCTLKVYSDEFLQRVSQSIGGKTLEGTVKKKASEEDDFYLEISKPVEGLLPDTEVHPFSEEEIEEAIRDFLSGCSV